MPTTLAQKLQIKPGWKLVLVNPPEDMADWLVEQLKENMLSVAFNAPAPTAIPVSPDKASASSVDSQPSDVVLLFVNNLAETQEFTRAAIGLIKPGGPFWIAYPKGSSGHKTDVNRDRLWEAVLLFGWRAVRQIALDDTWSAMRFKPQDDVER